ncbi:MAG: serine hydrolase domain-containing protein [Bacillota bacterium]
MTRANWIQQWEAYIGRRAVEHRVPGIAVGMAAQGEPAYLQGFGWRDRERGLPVTPETVFGIASITKSFTGVAIMQLQEQGILSVHDPVVRYLPAFRTPDPAQTKAITLHHLLSHTAGLPPLPGMQACTRDQLLADPRFATQTEALRKLPQVDTPEQFLDFMAGLDYQLLGAPGEYFSYSNDGYVLLGLVIAAVSGVDYPTYIQRQILEPAGMARSTLAGNDLLNGWENVTQLYVRDGAEAAPAPGWAAHPFASAAGMLKSTTTDMLRYAELFRTGGLVDGTRLLRPESVQAMTAPAITLGPDVHYGYGLMVQRFRGTTLVHHGGTYKGVKSLMVIAPEAGLTGITLINLMDAPATDIMMAGVSAFLGHGADPTQFTLEEVAISREALAEYAHTYPSDMGPVTFRLGESGLEVESRLTGVLPLRYVGNDTFLVAFTGTDETVTFYRNREGQIDKVLFHLRLMRKG